MRLLAATVLIALLLGGVAFAQQCDRQVPAARAGPPSVLIVMDASKSMAKRASGGQSRLDAAKASLRTVVDGLPDDARVGLRLYGHRVSGATRAEGCRDTELVTPIGRLDRRGIQSDIDSYRAVGSTPIGRALREAAGDLPATGRSSIVLVSDGGDNCAPPSPCDVAARIAAQGTDVSIQAVGFQVAKRASEELRCIARRGGGAYREAADADELAVALRALAARATRTFQASGRQISGGRSAAAATPIASGRFVDEIGPDDVRWYSLKLGRGQRVAASVALVLACPVGGKGTAGQSFKGSPTGTLQLQMAGPDGELETSTLHYSVGLFLADGSVESTGLLTQAVDPARGPSEDFDRPGTYRIRAAVTSGASAFGAEPLPLELAVNVIGAPPGAADGAARGEGEDVLALVAVALAAVVAGALAGIIAAVRGRARP